MHPTTNVSLVRSCSIFNISQTLSSGACVKVADLCSLRGVCGSPIRRGSWVVRAYCLHHQPGDASHIQACLLCQMQAMLPLTPIMNTFTVIQSHTVSWPYLCSGPFTFLLNSPHGAFPLTTGKNKVIQTLMGKVQFTWPMHRYIFVGLNPFTHKDFLHPQHASVYFHCGYPRLRKLAYAWSCSCCGRVAT